MKFCVDTLKINPIMQDANKRNTLHYAIQGRNADAINYAVNELKISALQIDNEGKNAYLFAASIGAANAFRQLIGMDVIPKFHVRYQVTLNRENAYTLRQMQDAWSWYSIL